MSASDRDEFFVGYLPVPASTRRFLWLVVAALALLLLGSSAALAGLRSAPARTGEQPNAVRVGILDAQAYGILWALEGDHAEPILLSRGGKFGAPDSVKKLHGQAVRLEGLLLERDGYKMLEVYKVVPRPVLTNAQQQMFATRRRMTHGEQTLRGEIVDIKCWLGRMKPGYGRTHRACAQFCIAGGIPPVLSTRDRQGREVHYVLTDLQGGPMNDAVLPYVAEPVEVRGRVDVEGDLQLLRIDVAQIRRL